MRVLLWFRRDLRLADHPALTALLRAGHRPIPVYVHAPEEEAPWVPGAASNWWLHHSLAALDGELRARGSRLTILRGPSAPTLVAACSRFAAAGVVWTRRYEPAVIARDTAVKRALRAAGLDAESYPGALLNEPWTVTTGSGGPYRVYTPYWRRVWPQLGAQAGHPEPAPSRLPEPGAEGLPLADLGLLPKIPWDREFYTHWTPGVRGAEAALEDFLAGALAGYAEQRDRPDWPGTSRLSPHLAFGEIGPRQILYRLLEVGRERRLAIEAFARELIWREFSYHLLYHYPHTPEAPLDPRFAAFPWAEVDPAELNAWQRGRTGIPIVDAGMRQLWQTGWMHNRVRMIVASVLTKNLRYPWQLGARWFWDTLVDADLANNTQGWQWSAGCGADAAPYFRIFNPVAQGERFDPNGDYVRRYVPELAALPAERIHQPWTIGGVPGYPAPRIDLSATRRAALAAYHALPARGHGASS